MKPCSMPKPTRQIRREQQAFERRQAVYEKRYYRQVLSYIIKTYKSIADKYEKGQRWNDIDTLPLEKLLNKLYTTVTLEEAKIEYQKTVEPYLPKKKDIIDDLVELFTRFTDRNVFQIWRELLQQFISVRTTGRIVNITATTERKITNIISKGIENGEGAEVIARTIRREAGEVFNRNRALSIARTEVVTSMNQGKYLSAKSSPYVMVKRWSPVYQPGRTRASHLEFWDSEFIPLEQDFMVGIFDGGVRIGEEPALYPADLRLSARNTINCRCSLITQPAKRENGTLIRKA